MKDELIETICTEYWAEYAVRNGSLQSQYGYAGTTQ